MKFKVSFLLILLAVIFSSCIGCAYSLVGHSNLVDEMILASSNNHRAAVRLSLLSEVDLDDEDIMKVKNYASGVAISDRYILTVEHFCKMKFITDKMLKDGVVDRNTFGFRYIDEEMKPIDVVTDFKIHKLDKERDLCIIDVGKHSAKISELSLSSENLRPGQPLSVVGSPLSYFPVESRGKFVERKHGVLIAHAKVNRGNSGGPVLDYSGKVVGIVTKMHGDDQHIAYIVKVEDVWRLIKSDEVLRKHFGIKKERKEEAKDPEKQKVQTGKGKEEEVEKSPDDAEQESIDGE